MHEHSFIEAILLNVKDRENVLKIILEVGELAGIEACHLKEHILERVDFNVETIEVASKVKCSCGFEGRAKILERMHDFVVFDCVKCGGIPEIIDGDKVKILKVVYSDKE